MKKQMILWEMFFTLHREHPMNKSKFCKNIFYIIVFFFISMKSRDLVHKKSLWK